MILNNVQNLIRGFFRRAGSYIFMATLISRIASFLTHLVALNLILPENLGVIVYVLSFISFLLPMAGLGIQQSLVRYGALLKNDSEKEALFLFSLKKGLLITVVLIILLIVISTFVEFKFLNANQYFKFLSLYILTHFLLGIIKVYFRLKHKNKIYAILEITYSVLLLVGVFLLTYFFKERGYVIALIVIPFLTFLLFINKLNINYRNSTQLDFIDLKFWKYGFFAGLSYVATLLLIEIDNILIGDLLNDPKEVTLYKYIALIPLSLLFLPRILITTDFVNLTERINEKEYIFNYIKSYFLIFITISVILLLISYVFIDYILLLFGPKFRNYSSTFLTLMFGVTGILTLRGLFGNLLSAIGKAHINFIIALIALSVNVISNHYFIPKFGILGASYTSAIIMWLTGLLTFILFLINYKKLSFQ